MKTEEFLQTLKNHADSYAPNFGDDESVLTLLYEAYAECNKIDDGTIKADFNELYRLMNGMLFKCHLIQRAYLIKPEYTNLSTFTRKLPHSWIAFLFVYSYFPFAALKRMPS